MERLLSLSASSLHSVGFGFLHWAVGTSERERKREHTRDACYFLIGGSSSWLPLGKPLVIILLVWQGVSTFFFSILQALRQRVFFLHFQLLYFTDGGFDAFGRRGQRAGTIPGVQELGMSRWSAGIIWKSEAVIAFLVGCCFFLSFFSSCARNFFSSHLPFFTTHSDFSAFSSLTCTPSFYQRRATLAVAGTAMTGGVEN